MFSSLTSFDLPSVSSSPLFTDSSLELFPHDSDTDTSTSPPTDADVSDDPSPIDDHPLRRSTRVSVPPSHLQDYHCYYALASLHEPRSFREASTHPSWQKAMNEELRALNSTHTWDMVDLPLGKSVVGCKWVYKIKTHSDGSIE